MKRILILGFVFCSVVLFSLSRKAALKKNDLPSKNTTSWTAKDLEKMKKYMKQHNKDYTFIFVGGTTISTDEKKMLEIVKKQLEINDPAKAEIFFLSQKMAIPSRKFHSYSEQRAIFKETKTYPVLLLFEHEKRIDSSQGLDENAVIRMFDKMK